MNLDRKNNEFVNMYQTDLLKTFKNYAKTILKPLMNIHRLFQFV